MPETEFKNITLIRHGESQSQANPDVDGINPDLFPRGEQQAASLRDKIKELAPDSIIVSPLIRAFRTYRLSHLQCSTVQFDPRLVESDWGIEGRYEGVEFDYLDDSGTLVEEDWLLRPVKDRMLSLVDTIPKSDGGTHELDLCYDGFASHRLRWRLRWRGRKGKDPELGSVCRAISYL